MILKALRESEAPLSTAQIAILRAGGHGEGARPTMAPRVRAYLKRRRVVHKNGSD
jgi:hypothetical protein